MQYDLKLSKYNKHQEWGSIKIQLSSGESEVIRLFGTNYLILRILVTRSKKDSSWPDRLFL